MKKIQFNHKQLSNSVVFFNGKHWFSNYYTFWGDKWEIGYVNYGGTATKHKFNQLLKKWQQL